MKVAVLGAGGPAGVNALRALSRAGHDLAAVDSDPNHLIWCEQYAETFLWPELPEADVYIPQPDGLVLHAVKMELKGLLPSEGTVWACQDKYSTSLAWYRQELRDHPPLPIKEPWSDHLNLARDALGLPIWLRATKGAGAKGAVLIRSLETAFHWIRFWESRGADIEWMAEEYLPGRDLAWSSIWYDGELVTSFARERLEYIYPHLTPEGLTGTPTVARIVCDATVNATARNAVLAVDSNPHGIFSVDLREDASGIPRPTEINAGRGFTTFGLWSLYTHNFLDLVVRLARDGMDWNLVRPDIAIPPVENALPDGLTLSRHIDCGHVFSNTRVGVLV